MPDFDPIHTVRKFINLTEDMLCHATVENKPHPLVQHAATTFCELVSSWKKNSCLILLRVH